MCKFQMFSWNSYLYKDKIFFTLNYFKANLKDLISGIFYQWHKQNIF